MEGEGKQPVHSLAERVHRSLKVGRLPGQSVPLPRECVQPFPQGSALLLPLIMPLLQGAHGLLAARELLPEVLRKESHRMM